MRVGISTCEASKLRTHARDGYTNSFRVKSFKEFSLIGKIRSFRLHVLGSSLSTLDEFFNSTGRVHF